MNRTQSIFPAIRTEPIPQRKPTAPQRPSFNFPTSASSNSSALSLEQRLASLEALLRDAPRDLRTSTALRNRVDAHLSPHGSPVGTPVRGRSVSGKTKEETDESLDELARGLQGMNLSNGYLYLDEIGQTKWQGK
jgi:hypothetical protein